MWTYTYRPEVTKILMTLLCETGSLTCLELTHSARLAGQSASGIHLSPRSQPWDLHSPGATGICRHIQLLHMGSRDGTQVLMPARQAFYRLNYLPSVSKYNSNSDVMLTLKRSKEEIDSSFILSSHLRITKVLALYDLGEFSP